jgi:hypothetical protein
MASTVRSGRRMLVGLSPWSDGRGVAAAVDHHVRPAD